MTSIEPTPAVPPPDPSRFQFSLQTLLLLFVVLASSLGVFGAGGVVVFVLVVGLALFIRYAESWWSLLFLALVVLALMCLLLPGVQSARESGRHSQCLNNLRQIVMALQNYHSANGCFPPAYVADKNGKPMHSWRVLILPYLDHDPLYKTYNFNEPWDGPNNQKLLAARPRVYACPSDPDAHTSGITQTSYVAVVGPKAAWAGEKSRKMGPADFPGGSSRTIMVVEVADSGIAWTEPRDLSLDALDAAIKPPAVSVSSRHARREEFFYTYERRSGANVAIADGSVYYLPPGRLLPQCLRKILQVGSYQEEEIDSYAASYDEQCRLNWPNIAALAVWLLSVGALLTRAVRSRNRLHKSLGGCQPA